MIYRHLLPSALLALLLSLLATNASSQTILFSENFSAAVDSVTPPSGWTNVHIPTGTSDPAQLWRFDDFGDLFPGNISGNGFNGDYAVLNSDEYGFGQEQSAALESPSFDASASSTVILQYSESYRDLGSTNTVEVSTDNGSTWTVVKPSYTSSVGFSGGISSSARTEIDITAEAAGFSNVKVRWYFAGDYHWWWAIDSIVVVEPASLPEVDLAELSINIDDFCNGLCNPVRMTITNTGFSDLDLSSDPVTLTVDVTGANTGTYTATANTGTVLVGDSLEVLVDPCLDLSDSGLTTITAYVSSAASFDPLDDTVVVSEVFNIGVTASLPYFNDFEGLPGTTNATAFPRGWNASPSNTTGAFRWNAQSFGTGSSSSTGPTGAFSGSNFLMTEASSGSTGDEAVLVTNCFDFTSTNLPQLDFYYHMFGSNMGNLYIEIEDTAGSGWIVLDSLIGQQQSADSDPWLLYTRDLSDFIGFTLPFRLRAERGPGFQSDIHIDDFRVFDAGIPDLALSSSTVLTGGAECFSSHDVEVVLTNLSILPIAATVSDPIVITVEVTSPSGTVETRTLTLDGVTIPASGGTLVDTLTPSFDFSALGEFTIEAYLDYAADGSGANDTLVTTFFGNKNSAYPYGQDFEGFASATNASTFIEGFSADPSNTTSATRWNVEDGPTPSTTTGPSGAFEGTRYVHLETSQGALGDSAFMILPCMDFTSLVNPTIDFYYHMWGSDMGTLEVGVLDGGVFTSYFSISGEQQANQSDPWIRATTFLSPEAGKNDVRIAFLGTRGSSFNGDIAIDSIRVYESPVLQGLGIADLNVVFEGDCPATDTLFVTLEGTQAGDWDFSVDPVTVNVNVTGAVTSTLTTTINSGTLMFGETERYALSPLVNFGTTGTILFDASFTSATDSDPANNTLIDSISVFSISGASFPYTETFESMATSSNASSFTNGITPIPANTSSEYRWNIEDGGTPSSSTGPTGPFEGSRYAFTEASSGSTGDSALLVFPCMDFSTLANPTVNFYYHMNGAAMGTLEVGVLNSGVFTSYFTISGEQQANQADPWIEASAFLTPEAGKSGVQVAFLAIRGTSFTSDIAIDSIRFFEAPIFEDLALSNLDITLDGVCPGLDTVSFTLTNTEAGTWDFAANPVTVSANITGAVTASLSTTISTGTQITGSTVSYDFPTLVDFGVNGDIFFELSFSSSNDLDPANNVLLDTIRLTKVVSSNLPYAETFESMATSTNASTFTNGITVIPANTTASYRWTIEDFGTSSSGTGPTGAFEGSRYAYTEASNGSTGDSALLIMPCADFSTLGIPAVSFYYHMFGDEFDRLEVGTFDGTFTPYFTLNGDQQANQTDPYEKATVFLAAEAGNSAVRVAFLGIKGTGFEGDIAIDSIRIFDSPPVTDFASSEVFINNLATCPGTNDVGMRFVNLGSGPIDFSASPVTLNLDVTGAVTSTQTVVVNTGVLNVFDTLEVLFPTPINFEVIGVVDLVATVNNPDDIDLTNDTARVSFDFATITSYPYTEGFEAFATATDASTFQNGWSTTPANTSAAYRWNVGTGTTPSSSTGPSGASSGSNYVYVEASSSGANADLLSPCFDLSSLTRPAISYDYHMYGSTTGDLQVVVDNGVSQLVVSTISGQQQTASSDPWITDTVSLAPFAGQTVKVIFRAVRNSSIGDISLDSIVVFEAPPAADLSLSSLNVDNNAVCVGATATINAEVVNTGNIPFDFAADAMTVTVNASDAGTGTFTATVNTGTLAVGDTLSVALAPALNSAASGVYTLDGVISVNVDADADNDSVSISLGFFKESGLYTEGFEGLSTTSNADEAPSGWILSPFNTSSEFGWNVEDLGTISSGTGPTAPFEGNRYMYTEASDGIQGDVAQMVLPCFDFSGIPFPALTFKYHMHGANMGDLYVFANDNTGFVDVWRRFGEQQANQTDPWLGGVVPLDGYSSDVRFAFLGVRGSSFDSDMAIDFVQVRSVDFGFASELIPDNVFDPSNTYCANELSANQVLTFDFQNTSGQPVDSIMVEYDINGVSGMDTVDLGVTLLDSASTAVTLPGTFDFSAFGTYSTSIIVSPLASGYGRPDTTVGSIIHESPIIDSLFADICDGDTFTFNGTDLTVTGIYADTFTAASGCDSIVVLDLNVAPLTIADAGPDTTVCVSAGSYTFANLPMACSWSGPGLNAPSLTVDLTTLGPGEYTYVATCDSGSPCLNSDTMILRVDSTTMIMLVDTISPSTCGGSDGLATVVLSDTANISIMWSNGDMGDTARNLAAGSYSVTITDTVSGCSATSTFTITDPISTPVVIGNNDTLLCANDAPLALTATPSGGTWSGTGVTGTTFDPATASPGSYTLTYQVVTGGCTNLGTFTVQVAPNPATPTLSITDSLLRASGSTATQYDWYVDSTFLTSTSGDSLVANDSGFYFVVAINSDGCESDTSNVVLFEPTSVRNLLSSGMDVRIYPNPSSGEFTVDVKGYDMGRAHMKVLNATGQVVVDQELRMLDASWSMQLELNDQPNGMYIMMITDGEKAFTTKLQIQR